MRASSRKPPPRDSARSRFSLHHPRAHGIAHLVCIGMSAFVCMLRCVFRLLMAACAYASRSGCCPSAMHSQFLPAGLCSTSHPLLYLLPTLASILVVPPSPALPSRSMTAPSHANVPRFDVAFKRRSAVLPTLCSRNRGGAAGRLDTWLGESCSPWYVLGPLMCSSCLHIPRRSVLDACTATDGHTTCNFDPCTSRR